MYSRQTSWHDNKNQDTSSQLRYGQGSEHQILALFTDTKLGIVQHIMIILIYQVWSEKL